MSEHLNIGGEIRRAREAAGYSVSDVENITRIPTFIIKDIEKNKFNPFIKFINIPQATVLIHN